MFNKKYTFVLVDESMTIIQDKFVTNTKPSPDDLIYTNNTYFIVKRIVYQQLSNQKTRELIILEKK